MSNIQHMRSRPSPARGRISPPRRVLGIVQRAASRGDGHASDVEVDTRVDRTARDALQVRGCDATIHNGLWTAENVYEAELHVPRGGSGPLSLTLLAAKTLSSDNANQLDGNRSVRLRVGKGGRISRLKRNGVVNNGDN